MQTHGYFSTVLVYSAGYFSHYACHGQYFFFGFFLFFALIAPTFSREEEEMQAKIVKRLVPASAILVLLAVATPTKEDVALIVAGKVGIELSQSDEVKETSAKLYQLLQQKLDAALLEEQTDG